VNRYWPHARIAIRPSTSSQRVDRLSRPKIGERSRSGENRATLIPLVLAERARRADQAMRDEIYAGCERAPFNWEHRNAG
jgi:hypothetical protein